MYDNSQKIESELINLFKSVPNAIDIDSDYKGHTILYAVNIGKIANMSI